MEILVLLKEAFVQSFPALALTFASIIIPVVWTRLASKQRSQAEMFHREAHNLNLFQALSSPNQALQLAAAAVLVERLQKEPRTPIERSERASILRALISVTKDAPNETGSRTASPELSKFVADNVVRSLGAIRSPYDRGRMTAPSPLSGYDWLGARLDRAWWPGIDAHQIDFFGASLAHAGLRKAHLSKAVFYGAKLNGSVLVDADLREANFSEADLRGANLQGAAVEGAVFARALIDNETVLPDGFDPVLAGMLRMRTERAA